MHFDTAHNENSHFVPPPRVFSSYVPINILNSYYHKAQTAVGVPHVQRKKNERVARAGWMYARLWSQLIRVSQWNLMSLPKFTENKSELVHCFQTANNNMDVL